PRLGPPAIPVLHIDRGAIPFAVLQGGSDIEEEPAENEIEHRHAKPEDQPMALEERGFKNLGKFLFEPSALGSTDRRHFQTLAFPKLKLASPTSRPRSQP